MSDDTSQEPTPKAARGPSFFGRLNSSRGVRTTLIIAIGLLAGGGWAFARATTARDELLVAKAGLSSVRTLAESGDIEAAVAQATIARKAAVHARSAAHDPTLRLARIIPVLGRQVGAVQTVTDVAAKLSTSAERILVESRDADILWSAKDARIDISDWAGLTRTFKPIIPAVDQALEDIDTGISSIGALQDQDLIAPIAEAVDEFEAQLLDANHDLGIARGLYSFFARSSQPGKPLRLLFLAQDTWELRPSGGFIGSFGILEIGNGKLDLVSYKDATTLPYPEPAVLAPEPLQSVLPHPWSLTGAGWWPNFPQSAASAQKIFRASGGTRVDGVIAATDDFSEDLIRGIGGTITVPGYPDILTPDNVAERVLYHVELKRPLEKPRKRFLTLLTHELFSKLQDVPKQHNETLLDALATALRARHLQIQLNDPDLNRAFDAAGWNGAMTPPERGDFFSIADADMGTDKATRLVDRHIVYHVRPTGNGRLGASVTITTRNQGEYIPIINTRFHSYLRIYAPKGASLATPDATRFDTLVQEESGFTTFGSAQVIYPLDRAIRRYEYDLPEDIVQNGVYRLAVRPQAGTSRDTYEIHISMPGNEVDETFKAIDGDQVFEVPVDETALDQPAAAFAGGTPGHSHDSLAADHDITDLGKNRECELRVPLVRPTRKPGVSDDQLLAQFKKWLVATKKYKSEYLKVNPSCSSLLILGSND